MSLQVDPTLRSRADSKALLSSPGSLTVASENIPVDAKHYDVDITLASLSGIKVFEEAGKSDGGNAKSKGKKNHTTTINPTGTGGIKAYISLISENREIPLTLNASNTAASHVVSRSLRSGKTDQVVSATWGSSSNPCNVHFHTVLRPSDKALAARNRPKKDVTAQGPLAKVNPKRITIIVGLIKGNEKLPLGVTNFLLSGEELNAKLSLPIQCILPNDLDENKSPQGKTKGKKGFSPFKRTKSKKLESQFFSNDSRSFGLHSRSALSICLQVKFLATEGERKYNSLFAPSVRGPPCSTKYQDQMDDSRNDEAERENDVENEDDDERCEIEENMEVDISQFCETMTSELSRSASEEMDTILNEVDQLVTGILLDCPSPNQCDTSEKQSNLRDDNSLVESGSPSKKHQSGSEIQQLEVSGAGVPASQGSNWSLFKPFLAPDGPRNEDKPKLAVNTNVPLSANGGSGFFNKFLRGQLYSPSQGPFSCGTTRTNAIEDAKETDTSTSSMLQPARFSARSPLSFAEGTIGSCISPRSNVVDYVEVTVDGVDCAAPIGKGGDDDDDFSDEESRVPQKEHSSNQDDAENTDADGDNTLDEETYGSLFDGSSCAGTNELTHGDGTAGTATSIGDETLDSVEAAKDTLRRYASRLGRDIVDVVIDDDASIDDESLGVVSPLSNAKHEKGKSKIKDKKEPGKRVEKESDLDSHHQDNSIENDDDDYSASSCSETSSFDEELRRNFFSSKPNPNVFM